LPLPLRAGGADIVDSMPMPQALIVFSIRPVPPTAAARYKKSLLLIIGNLQVVGTTLLA
jgi:hypothetical protein